MNFRYNFCQMDEGSIDYLLKIVIIGDSGVGKTNLLTRYTKNTFNANSRNTIGVDFCPHDLVLNGKTIKAQFWDTAGQEKYRALSSAYYKNAHGAIVVYDILKRESFENVGNWLSELMEHGEKDIVIMLLGNKTDLESERQVTTEEGFKLAQSQHIYFMETSAKTNQEECVNKAFLTLMEEILKTVDKQSPANVEEIVPEIKASQLARDRKENLEKKSCC